MNALKIHSTAFLKKLRIVKQVLLSKAPAEDKAELFNCPVCGALNTKMIPFPVYYFEQWQKFQTIHNPLFIETMNIAHYMCSRCFAFDRERIIALYLEEYLPQQTQETKLLDIAPGKALKRFLKNYPQVAYRSMDLSMEEADDKLDITDMHAYEENKFDFFICSHVLEHIGDDIKAMKELYRVLNTSGKGVVMVPINLQLNETIEDANCTDIASRWKYFFQDDHVRMYAKKDFIIRLQSVGFTVEQLGIDYFSKEVFEQNAIWPTSVLYVVSKQ